MATQERLYSYGEETSPTHKKNRAMKRNEATRTLQETADILGMASAAAVGQSEKRAIKKLVVGLTDRGIPYTTAILAIQKLLNVNNPRVVLDCLPEDYLEKTRQFAKKLDISDM